MYRPRVLACLLSLLISGCDGQAKLMSSNDGERTAGPRPSTTPTTRNAIPDAQLLLGSWEADDVDAKMGQVKIKLTFRDTGAMKLAAWSDIPFVGQVRDKSGSYEVNGNVISSEAIRGGTSVEYSFDGDVLIIHYKEGKTVRFHRI